MKSIRQLLASGLLGLHAFAATPQTVTFPDIPYQIAPAGPIALAATASSGLPVSYSIVSPEGVATLSGSTVTLTGTAGSVTLKASQAGSGTFDPAPDVYRTFAVGLASQRFVKVARGESGSHSVAIRVDATLWAWGNDNYGQLGVGGPFRECDPGKASGDGNWTVAACGAYHTVAVKADGTLWAWGRNADSAVGDATETDRICPVPVGGTATWATVACGHSHSIAIRTDGTLWAWGGGVGDCALGNGTCEKRNSPVRVGNASNWATAAGGTFHTAALKTNGTLWAWGSNYYGQIAGGSSTNGSLIPVQIDNSGTWSAVACGGVHTVALKSDRTLWACGANWSGQIGDGTTTERRSLVQVGNSNDWAAVAAGRNHTMALKTDGTLWAWGYNSGGQLGDGTATDRHNPVQVGADRNWSAVACGSDETIAVKSDGSLWLWGYNFSGQQGVGPTPSWLWPSRAQQSLTFASPGNLPVGQPVAMIATASSGLPVKFVVSGPATITDNVLTPTAPGALRVTAYHQGDSAWWRTDDVTQTVMAFSAESPYAPFHSAMTTAGLTGPDAAPNAAPFGDKVPNLLKYAFKLNPSGPDASTMAPGGNSGLPAITLTVLESPAAILRFEFLRRRNSGLIYTPQKGAGLTNSGSWAALTDQPDVSIIDAVWERVIYAEPTDTTIARRQFGRVQVTLPP